MCTFDIVEGDPPRMKAPLYSAARRAKNLYGWVWENLPTAY